MSTPNLPIPSENPVPPEFPLNTFAELRDGDKNIVPTALNKTRTAFGRIQLSINGQEAINGMESPISTFTSMLGERWATHAQKNVGNYTPLELTLEPEIVMALGIQEEYENFFRQSRYISQTNTFLQKENLPIEAWLSIVLASWAYAKNLDVICEYGEKNEALKIAIAIPLDFRKTWGV